ncbi:MAG: CPBP family intramembrane metalloprotease [Acidobacteria bacterium]|nr:CPBP family intramembrane metalloprotease [Acidobacteriota bacterium]
MRQGSIFEWFAGFTAVFLLFHLSAGWLGSDRGQFGVPIGLIVVVATVSAERLLFGLSWKAAAAAIGLGRPAGRGVLAAAVVSLLLLFAIPFFAAATNVSFDLQEAWSRIVPGLFFQAGIAEETLFRGYLFGHLRRRHNYWKAALLAAVPFALVHLILFYSLPAALAAASILLAVAMSLPLSRLFELGGNSIWAPSILHFTVQGGVKLLTASGESAGLFPFFWIAACAVIPFGVYAVRGKDGRAFGG